MHYFQFIKYGLLGLTIAFIMACQPAEESNSNASNKSQKNNIKIFEKVSSNKSKVNFNNKLSENETINYFTYPYIYMGGGVAAGDVNNDGLSDLYFTGNMVTNQLYLNKGNLKFEEITQQANVASDNRWVTGVTFCDVNADGWLDIYVSVSGKFATTKNQLFVNQGLNEKGIPTFIEEAQKRGLADEGQSTQATFFDYDNDGDVDVYVANYPFTGFKTPNYTYYYKMNDPKLEESDRLYKNNGNGNFTDVTKQAGVLNFGLSLSASVSDYNNDGWLDVYVSNDFASRDFFYINNKDGTFTEQLKNSFQQTSFFGMGSDAADLNNDGLIDLVQMDMTPADNRRNKANMASMNIAGFWEIVNFGLHYQYMYNAVQINQGIGNNSLPHFSNVAQFTNMASTDWSWASLCADFDNNGFKDVFVTNGTRRDINNKDYFNKLEKANYQEQQKFDTLNLTLSMPSEAVDNYVFQNSGNLQFENSTYSWGLNEKGFSNGAAYADLDNDGDLELIVNNIDAEVSIYKNTSTERKVGNYLKVKLTGNKKNPLAIGTKIILTTNNGQQVQEQTLSRGFQSSVDPVIHFGVDKASKVQSIKVIWYDGKVSILEHAEINTMHLVNYKTPQIISTSDSKASKPKGIFTDITKATKINYKHKENPYNDYLYEVLIPHTYSSNGPAMAVADFNNDGFEDFFIGSASGYSGEMFIQNKDQSFNKSDNSFLKDDIAKEDIAAIFFDADNDSDVDLYVVSGSNEFNLGSSQLQDRLYLNDGKSNFKKTENSLPRVTNSGSCVKAADFDNDGDIDLFVGGWLVPKQYPEPAKSYILQNEGLQNGEPKFIDVTKNIAPTLLEAGMVTDAVWTDFDNDQQLDLVIVGEWMPITILKNTNNKFEEVTKKLGLENTVGWWYSITADDFDKDGYTDLVAGNLGLNNKYKASPNATFDVYLNDYDKNGKQDIVLGYYNDGVQYPVRGKQCSSEQIPSIGFKYKDYNTFAEASLVDIYTEPDLEAGLHYQAQTFASAFIHNKAGASFDVKPLPTQAQLSSVNSIITGDINNDDHLDLILGGNLFGFEVETPRNDASYGVVLIGGGKGNFKNQPYATTGLKLGKDTKAMASINLVKGKAMLVANNADSLHVIGINLN